MGLHCFKKHMLSTNFNGNNFSMVKEYGRHEVSSIQVLIFVPVCVVVVFLTSIFLFQRAFYYFIGKIFFCRSLPIQKYLSDKNFCNCLPTERVFTEQVDHISLQSVWNFKDIHPQPIEAIWKHPELLAPSEPHVTPAHNKPPNVTLFFCSWLWTWFHNQESRIRKKWQKYCNGHESQRHTVNHFSQIWEIALK